MEIKCAHRGTFQGCGPRAGRPIDWLVELWRPYPDGEGPDTPADLVFPAESPLTIEWEQWKPETAIQGSMLTLKVESMTDREFIDYYTTRSGAIFIKVYWRDAMKTRNWSLYWRGTLDPEFYEEPYERLCGYDVTLTFSDFGCLDRMDFGDFSDTWGRGGSRICLAAILGEALYRAGMTESSRDWFETECDVWSMAKLVSINNETDNISEALGVIYVETNNFYDEEGKPETWRNVVEAVLLPLGLHILQRAGKVYIYDTDYVSANMDDPENPFVHWSGDSQTLGTAETYNNIAITFSPYCRARLINEEVSIDPSTNRDSYYNAPGAIGSSTAYYKSFEVIRSSTGSGAEYIAGSGQYARFRPLLGSCPSCTAFLFSGYPSYTGCPSIDDKTYPSGELLRLPSANVPAPIGGACLKLSIDLLFDPRYNPFESADQGDGLSNNADEMEDYARARWVTIPLRIVLRDPVTGAITHYYSNREDIDTLHLMKSKVTGSVKLGTWKPYREGLNINGEAWTQYYANQTADTALEGWSTNRATIGIWGWADDLTDYYTRLPKGMIMAYPPRGGKIEISILDGLLVHRRGQYNGNYPVWPGTEAAGDAFQLVPYPPTHAVLQEDVADITRKSKWWGYKDICLSIVTHGDYSDISADDELTESAVIKDAREELPINTICGTVREPLTGMLGLYFLNDSPVWSMKRGARHNYIERLLCGTLYSQYAHRRTTLSGEASIHTGGFPVWMESNTPGLFIISSSTLDAITGTEQITMVQLFADDFECDTVHSPRGTVPFVESEDIGQLGGYNPDDYGNAYDPWEPDPDEPDEPEYPEPDDY